jgi:hypothetical protein
VYNTTIHSATRVTPFELVYGFRSEVPSALRETPSIQYNYGDYLTELKGRLQSAHEIARQRLLIRKDKSKEHYDRVYKPSDFQTDQKVLLYDETVRTGQSKKLSPQFIGPYYVLKVGVNVTIKRGRTAQNLNVNRIKPLY